MTEIIHAAFGDTINIQTVKSNMRKLEAGLIAPAIEDTSYEFAGEHTADPIKSIDDINQICSYLLDCERYRDYMLFVVGINFGLRVSDLRTLRFSHLINEDFTFKDRFPILEKKTRNTRAHKKNRYITVNEAVMDAVTLYLENTDGVRLSDYMFRSESYRGRDVNAPLTARSIDRILKGIASDLHLDIHMSTHTLRKTFGAHQMIMSGNDPRKLLLLQKMFGHSTSAQTLTYIGLTSDEIDEAYRELNLGSATSNYMMRKQIIGAEMIIA